MKVILFGASGMVGQGVLRECLLDPEVTSVVSVGRTALKEKHEKLRDVVHPDLLDLSPIDLSGLDACFFCLGITSAGMNEADYRRITHDMTMAAAHPLAEANPSMTFIYVSGAGTDSTERGRSMWARVKGQTENELLALPLSAYMFRPGIIQPLHGITSNTRLYRILYRVSGPVIPLLRKLFPNVISTTEQIGHAMLNVARFGAPKRILESADIIASSR